MPCSGGRGLTIGCRGGGALHAFGRRRGLRAGPAPLTLGALGGLVWLCVCVCGGASHEPVDIR